MEYIRTPLRKGVGKSLPVQFALLPGLFLLFEIKLKTATFASVVYEGN